jgi:REP element-mobilizing transposase RayT
LKGHDYSKGSRYFITICTQGKAIWFGNILNQQMILSESGQIAKKLWYEIPEHFPFISLDEFVVMPNHVHGIVIIQSTAPVETLHATSLPQQPQQPQQRQQRQQPQPSPNTPKNEFMSSISPKPGSLATVIRSYKSAVSKNIHLSDHNFSWQPRYYDHIIHSDRELDLIRNYIINNPVKWDDMFLGRCMQRPYP